MWTVTIVSIVVVVIAVALARYLPDATQGEIRRTDLTDEQDTLVARVEASKMLIQDKQLNEWEKKFLTKISKSKLNLTENQADKVHDMYENFIGVGG